MDIYPLLNNYRLAGVNICLALGTGVARAWIYDGAKPVLGGNPAGNLLVEIPLKNPLGTIADGQLTVTPTDEAMIAVSGIGSWARIVNGNGDYMWDCTVSDINGTGEIKLSATQLYAGGYVALVSGLLV